MAQYKKRADGRYSKQITVGHQKGKPVKKTVYGKTIKELEKNFRDLMILVDRGVILDNQGMTVKELYEEWYRREKQGKIRRNTECSYMSVKTRVVDGLGEMKVKDMKKYNIETFITGIEKEGYSSTAKSMLGVLKSMFNYAVENDIVVKNPCTGLSVKHNVKPRRILNDDERESMDKAMLKPREKALLYLFRYTGMRRGEIFALRKSDIYNDVINVNKTLIDDRGHPFIQDMTKTDAGERCIPVFLRLVKPLRDYVDTVDDYLFLNRNKKFISIVSQDLLFSSIAKKSGIGSDITMHCFRHNFISECYSAKVDIKKVQAWVGHDDVSTTLNIYAKLSKQEVQDGTVMDDFYGSQTEVKQNSRINKTS